MRLDLVQNTNQSISIITLLYLLVAKESGPLVYNSTTLLVCLAWLARCEHVLTAANMVVFAHDNEDDLPHTKSISQNHPSCQILRIEQCLLEQSIRIN